MTGTGWGRGNLSFLVGQKGNHRRGDKNSLPHTGVHSFRPLPLRSLLYCPDSRGRSDPTLWEFKCYCVLDSMGSRKPEGTPQPPVDTWYKKMPLLAPEYLSLMQIGLYS